MRRRRYRLVIGGLLIAFVAAACSDNGAGGATTITAETSTTLLLVTTTTRAVPEVFFDVGVTMEPCPGEGHNPENGCIFLGIVTDLSDGPFRWLAIPYTQAQEDFWRTINEEGGLGGFDIAITEETTVTDALTDADQVAGYAAIAPNIAMLAQSLGTSQTLAALPDYLEDNTVAAPMSRWSGWSFDEIDDGAIIEVGAPYCLEAMTGFDFVATELLPGEEGEDGEVAGPDFTYAIVAYPDLYGADYAAGVRIAAARNGLGSENLVADLQQEPVATGGDVTAVVEILVDTEPDVVFLATGPEEAEQIIGGTYTGGHQTAVYIGAGPSWHPEVLSQEALFPIFEAYYYNTTPWGAWNYDSAGHATMREVAEAAGRDPNPGYTAGWISQYAVKAVLEQAIENQDVTRDDGGLLAAVEEVESVDFEGMLPARSYAGDPNDVVERDIIIHEIDAIEPDGLKQRTSPYTGPTASSYEYNEACSVPINE